MKVLFTGSIEFIDSQLGNSAHVKVPTNIETLEAVVGKQGIKNLFPLRPGDVCDIYSDTSELDRAVGYESAVEVNEGVRQLMERHCGYYGLAA